ncbi:MAG: hypothetical protein M1405_00580 [Patescibacteria group bacterium]|nr:hypothetical protein [Patescibacteria group bacterium]
MALSPDARPGFILPTGLPGGVIITPERRPQPPTGGELQIPVNPKLLTPESFRTLDGYMQETVLLSLLRDNGLGKVNELRPDFNVWTPLNQNEMAMSFLIEEITKRKRSITVPPSFPPDSLFAQIHSLAYPIDGNELAARLEEERQKAQFEFPNSHFAPSRNIGSFSAARRYLGNLSLVLKEEEAAKSGTKNRYTREFFKPAVPINAKTDSDEQKEIFRRQQAAVDAYVFENALVGVPFS